MLKQMERLILTSSLDNANDEAYKTAIDEAIVNDGAKIIVTPGYLFEPAILKNKHNILMLSLS